MNVNQLYKSAESKFAEALAVPTVTLKIIKIESATLEIAQEVDNEIKKTKKQVKKRAQKQRKHAKLGEAIESFKPSFGTTGKNLCVEDNCFGVEKFLRKCKGCW